MNEFYVYTHQRNDTGEVFYVGKGKGRRYKIKDNRNPYWNNIVNKVGYTPEIVMSNLTEVDAFELEKFMIEEYKDMGIKLVNVTDGGDGVSGLKHSEESKEKMSKSRMGHKYNIGFKHSEETKKKISINHKGMIGKKHTDDVKFKISIKQKKPIMINSIQYPSIKDASNILNIPTSTIGRRLNSINFPNYQYI